VIPLKDENPTRRVPVVTILLIVANIAVYFLVQHGPVEVFSSPTPEDQVAEARFNFEYAAIPEEVTSGDPLTVREVAESVQGAAVAVCKIPFRETAGGVVVDDQVADSECFPEKNVWLAVLSSMFLHGGLLHLGGNMLFLWIFGNNIEDRLGIPVFVAFYLLSGLAAALAHIVVQPDSAVPIIGASGAIAGIMGAYLVWFPNAPIKTLFIFIYIIFFREVAAKWLLIFWFVLQFFTNANEGVAWVAHVGGFVFGVLVALVVRMVRGSPDLAWGGGPRRDYGPPDRWP
jgi:membrane associated rhomboid family serine protease